MTDQLSSVKQALIALKETRARLDMLEQTHKEPIAVIGLSCRFPGGANSPDAFWQLLRTGGDAVREVPPSRWDIDAFYDSDADAPGKMATRWGGWLDQIDSFDARFFGISPREATYMDPQHRIFLEVAWEALENAGQTTERLSGSKTGVFVGVTANDYWHLQSQLLDPHKLDAYCLTGNASNFCAGRLAYFLGLQGPTMAVDTACSSSLVAVHLACQSLRTRESHMAIAAGVNALIFPDAMVITTKAGMMAADGRCKTFDSRADGFVRGEGCGVVVLKRLSDAQADGDPILALIRGSAVNQDGASSGLTVPNGHAQQTVIRSALDQAHVSPGQIQYVESHGTGTALGDPIEARALGAVLQEGRPADHPCIVGTVKVNIGHLEGAAGVAGLIKTILALQHREIPPHLHLVEPSPRIAWHELPLRVPTQLTPWEANGAPRLAGVSSFGGSGTNAHVILEEAPEPAVPVSLSAQEQDTSCLLPLSARDPAALRALAQDVRAQLATLDPTDSTVLSAFCASASRRRTHHAQRLAVRGHTAQELCAHLEAFGHDQSADGLAHGQMPPAGPPTIVFVCPGQGSQWPGMARDLLAHDPVVAQVLTQVAQAFQPYVTWDLLTVLQTDPDPAAPWPIDVIQPTLFALTLALAARWQHWGITPSAYIGHSMGEVAAAYLAGALALDAAARIICRRSQLLRRVSGQGAMAVVDLPVAQAAAAIAAYPTQLAVAVCNSPHSTVLAGDPTALDAVVAQLQQQNVFCRSIAVDVASHSPQMDPLRTDLLTALGDLQPQAGSVPLYSTVDAQVIDGAGCDAAYWVRNLREPVQFATAVQQALAAGHTLFVELSPHPILLPAIATGQEAAGVTGALVASGQRDSASGPVLRAGLGVLYSQGCPVRWDAVYPEPSPYVPLPTYPWQRQRYWLDIPAPTPHRNGVAAPTTNATPLNHPWLTYRLPTALPIFETQISLATHPALADHQINGWTILPATVYFELVTAAGQDYFAAGATAVQELVVHQALALDAQTTWDIQVTLTPDRPSEAIFQVFGRRHSDSTKEAWALYANGRVAVATVDATAQTADDPLTVVRERCQQIRDVDTYYATLREQGVTYGPAFQGLTEIWQGDGEAFGLVRLPDGWPDSETTCYASPALLDSCFQLTFASLPESVTSAIGDDLYLFALAEQLTIYAPVGKQVWCHLRIDSAPTEQAETLAGHLRLFNTAEELVAEVRGLCIKRISRAALQRQLHATHPWLYTLQWQPLPPSTPTPSLVSGGSWLILTQGDPVGVALVEQLTAQGQHCILVQPGNAFSWQPHDTGVIAQVQPDNPADWHRLVEAALEAGQPPCRGVLHCWGLMSEPLTVDTLGVAALDAAQAPGCGSVLLLAKALLAHATQDIQPPLLWLVTQGTQAVAETPVQAVTHAPIWGLGRTLALEHPELWGGLIDLPMHIDASAADWIINTIANTDGEDQIAFRDGQRYVLRLLSRHEQAETEPSIQTDGVYLIVGGLGGLGLHVAAWLVAQGAQHLVLLGRSGLPPREAWADQPADSAVAAQIAAVQALESQGATVHVMAADVSDYTSMNEVFATIDRSMPPLRGIVHAATASSAYALKDMGLDALSAALRSKVAGTWVLHTLTKNYNLDFFVLFSSTTALLGAQGLGHYAAANSFLDSFAAYRRGSGLPAMSINWGTWDTIRGASQSEQQQFIRGGLNPMPAAEALALLGTLLDSTAAQQVVADIDWATLKPLYEARRQRPLLAALHRSPTQQPTNPSHEKASSALLHQLEATPAVARREVLAAHVRSEVAAVLGFTQPEALNDEQGFFQLGMDSLMAVALRKRMETHLGRAFPSTLAFNYPTVAALTAYLLQELFPTTDSPEGVLLSGEEQDTEQQDVERRRILAERDELSEEELVDLLAQKLEQIH